MRYRLRTLVLLTAIVPPLLAAGWFWGKPLLAAIAYYLRSPIELIDTALELAVIVGLPVFAFFALFWMFALVARILLYICRHPDNRE
jgi:hypothetical protein